MRSTRSREKRITREAVTHQIHQLDKRLHRQARKVVDSSLQGLLLDGFLALDELDVMLPSLQPQLKQVVVDLRPLPPDALASTTWGSLSSCLANSRALFTAVASRGLSDEQRSYLNDGFFGPVERLASMTSMLGHRSW